MAKKKRSTYDKRIRLHPKQGLAYKSGKRVVLCCSGIQGGKSYVGALKLLRAVQSQFPAKDYPTANFAVVAPNYPALTQSTRVAFDQFFARMGTMNEMDKVFTLYDGRKIFFRTVVKNPNAVEGIPNCAFIWGDEAGQFPRMAWINIQSRTAFMKGQVFLTTTPYAMNWVKKEIIDKPGEDMDYFEWLSKDNPAFPDDEFERQKSLLSPREFRRKYMGIHEAMEGLIFDSFDSNNYIDPFELNRDMKIVGGIDWGFDHPFSLVVRCIPQDGHCYTISVFKRSGMNVSQQLDLIAAKTKTFGVSTWYCGADRPDMISELNAKHIPAVKYYEGNNNFREVNAGNQKHAELIRTNKYRVWRGIEQLSDLEDEYATYRWDQKEGEERSKEKPVKENDDLMDAERYATVGTYHLLTRPEQKVTLPPDLHLYVDSFDPTEDERRVSDWTDV